MTFVSCSVIIGCSLTGNWLTYTFGKESSGMAASVLEADEGMVTEIRSKDKWSVNTPVHLLCHALIPLEMIVGNV